MMPPSSDSSGHVVRLPLGDLLARLHLLVVLHLDLRTVDDLVLLLGQPGVVADVDLAVAVHGHVHAVGRTTDVERAHRQLRTRLTDGLRRDDADRLADVDQATTRQVAAVALTHTPRPVLQVNTERIFTFGCPS
jgi:hypothetical protein